MLSVEKLLKRNELGYSVSPVEKKLIDDLLWLEEWKRKRRVFNSPFFYAVVVVAGGYIEV